MLCHRTQHFFVADILYEIWIYNCEGCLSENLESLLLKNIFIKIMPSLLLVTYAKDIFKVFIQCISLNDGKLFLLTALFSLVFYSNTP